MKKELGNEKIGAFTPQVVSRRGGGPYEGAFLLITAQETQVTLGKLRDYASFSLLTMFSLSFEAVNVNSWKINNLNNGEKYIFIVAFPNIIQRACNLLLTKIKFAWVSNSYYLWLLQSITKLVYLLGDFSGSCRTLRLLLL